MSGTIIVIDGLDACGKATQVEQLRKYYLAKGLIEGTDFATVSFPRYEKSSSSLVKSYLSGEFGKSPDEIDAYTASMIYALDRAISFKTEQWGEVYRNGGIVIADRYTSSNIIHQVGKFLMDDDNLIKTVYEEGRYFPSHFTSNPIFERFVKWVNDTEFGKLGIPQPNLTIFLMTSKDINMSMLHNRNTTEVEGDIHELNTGYLDRCRFSLNAYAMYVTLKDIPNVSFLQVYDHTGPLPINVVTNMITSIIESFGYRDKRDM